MQITDVKVRRVESENRMKAIANVTFDNAFAVHDIKVIEPATAEKPFIAMPSKKTPKGDWRDIAHPINSETRAMIENAILEEYYKLPNESSETSEGAVEE
ncbi:MAG: septation regulator SpoVG [Clostridia bacterium]|nr:septation regulator SpoVG [Clostridia bacterium]